ncbi:MAG: phosphotransferase [Acidimicrobiales bacterium]
MISETLDEGLSGARLYRARRQDGSSVVLKHLSPSHDWMMRATRDQGREALMWEAGLFASLPSEVGCPIVSAVPLGDDWIIVLDDITPELQALHGDPTPQARRMLTAVDAIHNLPVPADTSMFCTAADRLRIFSPVRRLLEWRGDDIIPKELTKVWEAFAELPAVDVVDAVLACVDDPAALLERVAQQPHRVLHGDLRLPNLGASPTSMLAIDWGLSCYAPPELDVVWLFSDAAFWCTSELADLIDLWIDVTGGRATTETLDLAFIFHAAMGEIGYLALQLAEQPPGSTQLTPDRLAWWLGRVRDAFDRVSL